MPYPPAHNPFNAPFIELQSVDSTNNYARSLIYQSHLPDRQGLILDGTAIFAHDQVAGKAQRGKTWATEKDANITMSIVFKPELSLSAQFQLSACTAVAVADFFSRYAGEDVKIKWPNDLYWQDRKAGGILIENVLGAPGVAGQEQRNSEQQVTAWKWAIVGIGTNINQTRFHPDLPNPVSLKQITGKNFDALNLAKELWLGFMGCYRQLKTEGFKNIYTQYLNQLYKKNETVRLKKKNRIFEAVIEGVSPAGLLITRHRIEEEFNVGEIEWII